MNRVVTGLFVLALMALTVIPTFPQDKNLAGDITLSGAWALYPMAVKWGEEFGKIYPGVRIDVQAGGAGKGIADALAGVVDLGMVSREVYPAEVARGAFAIAVCKDAVVPTANAKNPFWHRLAASGVKKEVFASIWITEKATTWGDVLGTAEKAPIHVFTRSDACGAAETWAGYLGGKQEGLKGIGVYGDPGLAEAVRRDALGVGYNNINYAYDAKTKMPVAGIVILPLDLDGNGKLDDGEYFYQTRDAITAAIASGAYPSPPARDLYLVAKGLPGRPVVQEFLRWVLSTGQSYVADTGYIALSPEKLADQLKKLAAR
jgi:phosphate transport system substrate-binding protein